MDMNAANKTEIRQKHTRRQRQNINRRGLSLSLLGTVAALGYIVTLNIVWPAILRDRQHAATARPYRMARMTADIIKGTVHNTDSNHTAYTCTCRSFNEHIIRNEYAERKKKITVKTILSTNMRTDLLSAGYNKDYNKESLLTLRNMTEVCITPDAWFTLAWYHRSCSVPDCNYSLSLPSWYGSRISIGTVFSSKTETIKISTPVITE